MNWYDHGNGQCIQIIQAAEEMRAALQRMRDRLSELHTAWVADVVRVPRPPVDFDVLESIEAECFRIIGWANVHGWDKKKVYISDERKRGA